jgi:uncharacterized protein YnzC (UPF0291/DUF896 family)
MSSLVRQLIAFDILKQELEDVVLLGDKAEKDRIEDAHLQLLKQCSQSNQDIIDSTKGISEYDFGKIISQVELEFKVSTKQLLTVHNKLIAWVITFFVAKAKANSITAQDFSEQAEVRLDLWQTKAAKAKNQIKTLASALGKAEYVEFITQYRLKKTELMWPLGK